MEARPGLGSVSRVRTCPVLPGPSKGNAAPIPPSGLTHYPQPLAPAANRGSPDAAFTSPVASAPTSPGPPTASRPPTRVTPGAHSLAPLTSCPDSVLGPGDRGDSEPALPLGPSRHGQIALSPLTSRLMLSSRERLLEPGKCCPFCVQSSSESTETQI